MFRKECGFDSHSGYLEQGNLQENASLLGAFFVCPYFSLSILDHPQSHLLEMKSFYALLVAVLLAAGAQAQLQSPSPEIGESFVQKVVEAFEPLGEDSSTTGQVWDLSYLAATGGVQSVPAAILSVAATPNGKVFAGSDVAMEGGGQTTYYSYGDSYEYHGGVQNNLIVAYDDTEVYFPFPFALGESHEDTFSCEYGTAGITVYRTGQVLAECLSEGMLTLPGEVTYDNVYRLHLSEVLVDSTFLGTYEVQVEGDYFFSSAYPLTLAALIQYSTVDTPISGDPVFTETSYSVWMDSYTVGVDEPGAQAWAMLPNPARNQVTLVGAQSASEVVIYGLDGREWKRSVLRPGLQAQTIDVSELPVGTYVVHTSDGTAKKLVIER